MRIFRSSGSLRVERGDRPGRASRRARNRSAGATPPKESAALRPSRHLRRASAGRAPRPGRLSSRRCPAAGPRCRCRAGSSPRAPPRPPGCVSAASSGACSPRCDAGANATVPRSFSSGVHVGASEAAHSAAWPPCEWPAMITRLPRSAVELARGARPCRARCGPRSADQVRVRRPACRGPRSRCARPRSRPSASARAAGRRRSLSAGSTRVARRRAAVGDARSCRAPR